MTPLFEDNMIIIVEKPAGVLSQGDYSGDKTLIDAVKNYLKIKYDKPGNVFLGVIHRLDRQVSGIMVFARNSKAASRLSEQMREKKFIKFYTAIVPDSGNLSDEWIKIKNYIRREKNISYCSSEKRKDSQDAVLYFKKIAGNEGNALLLIFLETGRKHQIRSTMASLKIPVAGDSLYGSDKFFSKNAIALHSCYIEFMHPASKEVMKFFNINSEFNKFFDMNEMKGMLRKEINSFIENKKKHN
ncbi:MAG: RNA pseudouridine synthase [Spirochaetes bacterium]|nr:RNA pseudouridine synthase [Spirochaetota bacterium]